MKPLDENWKNVALHIKRWAFSLNPCSNIDAGFIQFIIKETMEKHGFPLESGCDHLWRTFQHIDPPNSTCSTSDSGLYQICQRCGAER